MAAETASIRTYLREDLKVGGPANNNPRTTGFIDNGIDSWNSFCEFNNHDIEELCKYLRRPGGNEAGVTIPAIAMKRLQLACFAAKYLYYSGTSTQSRAYGLDPYQSFQKFG